MEKIKCPGCGIERSLETAGRTCPVCADHAQGIVRQPRRAVPIRRGRGRPSNDEPEYEQRWNYDTMRWDVIIVGKGRN